MPNLTRPCLLLVAGLCLILACPEGWAHGGSHPTPWPTPKPGRTPTPRPPPPTTPPTGRRTPVPSAGRKPQKSTWRQWWEFNKWRFTWMPKKKQTLSGAEAGSHDILTPFLLKGLSHDFYDVRSASAIALGKARSTPAFSSLQKLVKDVNPVVVESAALALGMMGHRRSIPFLLGLLEDRKQPTRFRVYAAVALGLGGDETATRKLMGLAAKANETDEVKAACLLALSLLGFEEAGPLILNLLRTDRTKVQVQAVAITALAKLGLVSIPYGRRPVDIVKYLAGILTNKRKDERLRQTAAIALGALGPKTELDPNTVVRALSMAVNDRDADVRNFSLMAIAEIARSGRAVTLSRAVISKALRSNKHSASQAFACVAAGLSGDRNTLPQLRRLLTEGRGPSLRSAAAVGIGLLRDLTATRLLLAILRKRGDKLLKGYCCTALGIMNVKENREALPVLKKVLEEEADPELRAAAAMALTKLGDPGVLKVLVKALEDDSHYFRMSAVVAIGRLRDGAAVPHLIKFFRSNNTNNEMRAIICVALGNIAESLDIPVFRRISRYYNFTLKRFAILKQITQLL